MSRVAGDFLGETLAGDGAISDAPELTDDVERGPSDLLRGERSTAVLRVAGRDRGSGGDFRSTCGIGIGGTLIQSTAGASAVI